MAIRLGDALIYLGLKGKQEVQRDLDGVGQKVRGWGQQVQGFLTSSFSFAVGGVIQSALQSITQGIGALKDGMIGGNQAFEQYQTQFTVLIGNAELAQQRMQDLATFGAETPFELPGLVEGDRVLQSFGLHAADTADRFGKSGEQIRTVTGDIASGVGTSFQEIANLMGRFSAGATGEAISRMQELGITTRKELSSMGLEFSKAGELVSPVDEAMTVLLQVVEDRFGGMMDAQSATLGGMLSNLQDWAGNTLRVLGEPFFDMFKGGLEDLLAFLQPGGPADNVITSFAETIRLTLGVLGELAQMLVGDVGGSIDSFVQSLQSGLEQVNAFLRQLKDEIAGLSAADILGELGPGLDAINQRLGESLQELATNHETTINKMQGQIEQAGDRLGAAMAEIAEKYGPKIADLEEKITETRASFEERLTDTIQKNAKKQADLREQIAKADEKAEEKLTEIKADHMRKRRQLTTSLLLAESEEQYLAIQEQIRNEDQRFGQQEQKTKDANKEQVSELKKRLKEEEKEADKQEGRLRRDRDKALADLQEQLGEVTNERLKQEAEVQKIHDNEVTSLQQSIASQNDLYTQQQEDLKAMFSQQAADLEAEIQARAAAIGSGPAAQVAEFIRGLIDGFNELKTAVGAFLSEHADALIGLLIGIGAVLIGGGVIAAVAALGAALSGIGLPILALIGAIALLYVAWVNNFGGIQEKTAVVIEWLTTNIQALLEGMQQWWAENGEAVKSIANSIWEAIQIGLEFLQGLWQEHGDTVTALLTLTWENIKLLFSGAVAVITELIHAFAALLEGDWAGFFTHIGQATLTGWQTIYDIFNNNVEAVKTIVWDMIQGIIGYFTETDWVGLGGGILTGIGEGITNAIDGLLETAKEAGDALLDSMTGLFEISSPSAVFAKRVGAPIAQGIGAGVEGEMSNLQKTVQAALGSLVPGSLGAAVPAGPTTNFATFSPSVNLTMPPGAQVDEDSILKRTRDEMMDLLIKHYEQQE